MNVCAEPSPCMLQFIITIIIQDVCVHTGAISHDVRSLKEYIVLYTSALAEQFTTIHSFIQGGCCPYRSHYQSGQAAAGVNLQGEDSQLLCFDGFCLWVEKYSVFLKTDIITKATEMK